MTDAPTPRTRTDEPAHASSLPSLAITGASGNVGGTAARLLAERGLPLRLLANTPSRAPKLPGAIAVKCSYEDTLTTRVALEGVDVLFMVSAPESEDRLDKHIAFVDAAAASGVHHIVYLSFMNAAPDATFTLARTHFHTEEHIKASGMTYTFLRDNFYADFFVALPDEAGRILGPAGDGRVGVVAREDAGRVAAGVLADPGRYENQTLDVTGPQALTLDEIAQILTRVQARPVTYVRETIEEAYESRKNVYVMPDALMRSSVWKCVRASVNVASGAAFMNDRYTMWRTPEAAAASTKARCLSRRSSLSGTDTMKRTSTPSSATRVVSVSSYEHFTAIAPGSSGARDGVFASRRRGRPRSDRSRAVVPPTFPDAPVTARDGRDEAWAGSFVRASGVGVSVMWPVCHRRCCHGARHARFGLWA